MGWIVPDGVVSVVSTPALSRLTKISGDWPSSGTKVKARVSDHVERFVAIVARLSFDRIVVVESFAARFAFGERRLQLRARSGIERAAADQDQRGDRLGMRGRVCEREHRAPGFADQRGTRIGAARFDQLVQIGDVRRDRQRFAAAAALPRLQHMERIGDAARQRRAAAHRGRPAMQRDHARAGRSMCMHAQSADPMHGRD